MPISSENYEGLPVKGDPLMQGLLPGLEAGMRLSRLPKQLDTELFSKQLQNALSQIGLKFAPQRQQADLDSVLAGTAYTQAQTKYLPLEEAIKASNTQRANSRFGSVYQLSSAFHNMTPAEQKVWMAQNAEAYAYMMNGLKDAVLNDQQGQGNDFLTQILGQYFPTPQQQQGQVPSQSQVPSQGMPALLPPNKVLAANPNTMAQMPDQSINAPMPNTSKPTPEAIKLLALAAKLDANNKVTTTAGRQQAEASIKLDNFLRDTQPEFERAVNNVSQYAGLIGKGKLGIDALKAKSPEAYQDYLWLTKVHSVNLENFITQMESTSIAPSKQHELLDMLTFAYKNMSVDPISSFELINHVYQTLSDISKQRVAVANPLFPEAAQEAYGYTELQKPYVNRYIINEKDQEKLKKSGWAKQQNFTDEEINNSAKKHGISPQQLRKQIGLE